MYDCWQITVEGQKDKLLKIIIIFNHVHYFNISEEAEKAKKDYEFDVGRYVMLVDVCY